MDSRPGYGPPPNGNNYAAQYVPTSNNPYVYTQDAKQMQHGPECRRYYDDDRRNKTGIANALAALFIVCWCCTWPCHGPCCCGM